MDAKSAREDAAEEADDGLGRDARLHGAPDSDGRSSATEVFAARRLPSESTLIGNGVRRVAERDGLPGPMKPHVVVDSDWIFSAAESVATMRFLSRNMSTGDGVKRPKE